MMTMNGDQLLRSMFSEVQQDLEGEAITASVVAKTRKLNYTLMAGGVLVILALLAGVWLTFGIPLLEFAVLVSEFLTMTLVDLGTGWLSLVFLPVNNIASLLILTARGAHLAWKKLLL